MQKKRGIVRLHLMLLGLFVIAFVYSIFYLSIYGTGFKEPNSAGIQGLVISGNETEITEEKSYSSIPTMLKGVLIGIWIIFIFTSISALIHMKKEIREEIKNPLEIESPENLGKTKTELDVLYELIKQKKSLHLSTILHTFNIEKNTALEWGKILEAGNLINISYPLFGEPKFEIGEKK